MVVVSQLSLFHLQGLERHPQQNSFPFLAGLIRDKDQVHPALYRCLVPGKTAGKEQRRGCAPGVAEVAIPLRMPGAGSPAKRRAVLLAFIRNE